MESSSEKLIQQLNERAGLFNPAWILYLVGISVLVQAMSTHPASEPSLSKPELPSATRPFSAERKLNMKDEYSMLVGRYGQPNSLLSSGSDPLEVPTRTAYYKAQQLKIVFVPNGCVEAYETPAQTIAGKSRSPQTGKNVKKAPPCVAQNAGWTIVGYTDACGGLPISGDVAAGLLDQMKVKLWANPELETPLKATKTLKPNPTVRMSKQRPPNSGEALAKSQSPIFETEVDKEKRERMEKELRQKAQAFELRNLILTFFWLLVGLGAIITGFFIHKSNREKRLTRLVYELDEVGKQKYSIVQQAITHLSRCQRIWRIESRSTNVDWKRNAGASSLVRRTQVSIVAAAPPRVKVNVPVSCISTGSLKLFFLPDVILCMSGGRFGSLSYNDFQITHSGTRFIEEDGVPADAAVVGETWRYVNKNGGPDRRFNNNVRIPIAQYGMLLFTSSEGLNIHLNTSSLQQCAAFAACWSELLTRGRQEARSTHRPTQEPPPRPHQTITPQANALALFGLNRGASLAEISDAYHKLAQMYHPDKVAALGPEFRALADLKMKEINAAYKALRTAPE